jgi:hypothetical protein
VFVCLFVWGGIGGIVEENIFLCVIWIGDKLFNDLFHIISFKASLEVANKSIVRSLVESWVKLAWKWKNAWFEHE